MFHRACQAWPSPWPLGVDTHFRLLRGGRPLPPAVRFGPVSVQMRQGGGRPRPRLEGRLRGPVPPTAGGRDPAGPAPGTALHHLHGQPVDHDEGGDGAGGPAHPGDRRGDAVPVSPLREVGHLRTRPTDEHVATVCSPPSWSTVTAWAECRSMRELRPESRTRARGVPRDGPRGLRRWLRKSQEGAFCTEVSLRLREPQLPACAGDGRQLTGHVESDTHPDQT